MLTVVRNVQFVLHLLTVQHALITIICLMDNVVMSALRDISNLLEIVLTVLINVFNALMILDVYNVNLDPSS